MRALTAILAACVAVASAEVYLHEKFDDADWEKRWTVGEDWGKDLGEWKWVTPKYHKGNKAIKTGTDARHYSLSAPLDAEFNNEGKDLVVSYTVRHEQTLDCGGAYIKLLPPGLNQKEFGGDSEYSVMFGPDICGTGTRKTHAIFTYKGKNLLTKKNIKCETDQLTHRYTLIVHPDNSYEVQIDGKKVESGTLFDDWDFLPPKMIKDPEASKPDDWVDDAKIPDPEDAKPEGWDDEPAQVPDPDATKPDDWDDEEDGEWEPPMIDNPEYKGEWKPKMIDNPDYKGPWVHPEIENPDYAEDDAVYNVCKPCGYVGFELWQVKAGSVFDDIIVADSIEEVDAIVKEEVTDKVAAEKKAHDEEKEEERKRAEEERKRAEEEAKRAEEEAEDEDEDEDEDEEEEDEDHEEL
jgi:calreticulin